MSDEEDEFFDAQESMYVSKCTARITNTCSDDPPAILIAPIVTAPLAPAVVASAASAINTPQPTGEAKHATPVPVIMRREKSNPFLSVPTGMRQRPGLSCESKK